MICICKVADMFSFKLEQQYKAQLRYCLWTTRPGQTRIPLLFRPPHILPHQLIKPLIMLPIVLPQLCYNLGIHPRMPPSLGLPQTPVGRLVPQTIKTFRLVKIKIVRPYPRLQAQESFNFLQLRHRVLDQQISVDDHELFPGEHLQPPVNVVVVERDGERSIGLVDGAIWEDGELLEGFWWRRWHHGRCGGGVRS